MKRNWKYGKEAEEYFREKVSLLATEGHVLRNWKKMGQCS